MYMGQLDFGIDGIDLRYSCNWNILEYTGIFLAKQQTLFEVNKIFSCTLYNHREIHVEKGFFTCSMQIILEKKTNFWELCLHCTS
jgi:hypothetical protein